MIADAGRGKIHRYYTIQDGNHVDDRHDTFRRRSGRSCPATARRSSA